MSIMDEEVVFIKCEAEEMSDSQDDLEAASDISEVSDSMNIWTPEVTISHCSTERDEVSVSMKIRTPEDTVSHYSTERDEVSVTTNIRTPEDMISHFSTGRDEVSVSMNIRIPEDTISHNSLERDEEGVFTNLNTMEGNDELSTRGSGYCSECNMDFQYLKLHVDAFHKGKNECRCTICGQLFFKKVKLLKHLLRHDSNENKCSYCENKFRDFEELYTHLEEHTFLHIYLCHLCPKTFAVKTKFDEHLIIHSSPYKRVTLECLKCDMLFDAKISGMKKLRNHFVKQHKNNLKCYTCGKRFNKFVVFYNHCMRHKNKLPYICDECGLEFRQNCRLKEHVETTHLNVHNYECIQCQMKFKHKSSFDAHFRFHDESLRFSCNYCAKLFIRKVSLLDHFMEKSCSSCEINFHCRTTFDRHFKNFHSDDRLFSCDECNKSYTFENALKRHMTLEHLKKGENIFRCSLCPYETITRHNLNRHKRKKHANSKGPKIIVQISSLAK